MKETTEHIIVTFKEENGNIRHQKIYHDLTPEGYYGFSENPRCSEAVNEFCELRELVMRMKELKYVFWPSAPVDPHSGKRQSKHKKKWYGSPSVPG